MTRPVATPYATVTPRDDLRARALILALLWLAGVYLRLPVLVAPPLAPFIDADLGLSQTELGALTTLPVLMLSLGAVPGALVISRLGPLNALVVSLIIVAIASSGRALAPPVWMLFASTVLLGLAIAVMQPAFPALILRWSPSYAALASAVYMNGMLMGEFLAGGLTLPLLMPVLEDWRATILVWSVPAVPIALLLVASPMLRRAARHPGITTSPTWLPDLRQPRIWHLGVILGAASAGYFGANAYLAPILAARGEASSLPEFLLAINATQVAGSLAMIGLTPLLVGRRVPLAIVAWTILLGLLGLVVGELNAALVATVLLGISTCAQLILVVALVPQISTAVQAAPLAAGMFTVSYLLAFIVPLAGGIVADVTGDARAALLPLVLLAVAAIVIAHRSPHVERATAADGPE